MENIRNFSIIAHVDHGKSTLADRLIEFCGAITDREKKDQMLDTLDIERERGITIKLQAVKINYHSKIQNKDFTLHLIDTPGHVDFSYEVSRSLAACEGALLLIDASQGIEAQTVANFWKAVEQNLVIIPVINKIDLPAADPDRIKLQIRDILGLDPDEAILASAKEGIGIEEILEAITKRIPPPKGDENAPLKALIFDSYYDPYRGAVAFVRIFDGSLKVGDRIKLFSTGKEFEVTEVGAQTPKMTKLPILKAGDVGYIAASIKDVRDIRVGDTITLKSNPTKEAIPGFKTAKPMVFAGLYPTEDSDFEELRDALEKYSINDAAITYEPETSPAIGMGFRCGFLGLLHMEIVQERLSREYNIDVITTAPSVVYRLKLKNRSDILEVKSSNDIPDNFGLIEYIEEPYVLATIITPKDYVGNIINICQDKRGIQVKFSYLDQNTALLEYEMPLQEIIVDFHDKIKSASKGYASFDYEFLGYKESDLVKLTIMINKEPVDALSFLVHKDKAYRKARALVEQLKETIPRQLFEINVQAAIGSKIIASERIPPMRANVTAKCYGGDISRKRKLLEKQKEGKKRMKQFGKVSLPQEAFLSVLKAQ
ncbi:GTP-binding protein LepA [Hydrogenobaculum sp. Y04AAS1]|uniref:Elongation factor 4 n=1 Tax=Hydrogenobaculum sp. (strain Y04AAS1) TaxID=380749 RepID=LEPA_HYDS0|nr:RecName: Full=Elongation factor 4; Short=EF-4; AltName: Full=Ribosomal back-translocase LepA [Hydrogenobaculum sp. Y04AAS1]ACG56790.1 GTP-binding protein LepA [Hydrogenobaculum sp. Y04AAS1]HCT67268.1 elongation factor 4 [Hydrogenobaculum sp.]